MTDPQPDTYGSRLRQYERREHMTIWVAAGVAALVAFVGASALDERPALFTQLVLSAAVVAGAALAFARVQFEWAATLIKRDLDDEKVKKEQPLADPHRNWPSGRERLWTISLASIAVGWSIMLVGIWWPQLVPLVHCLTRG